MQVIRFSWSWSHGGHEAEVGYTVKTGSGRFNSTPEANSNKALLTLNLADVFLMAAALGYKVGVEAPVLLLAAT